MSSQARGKKPWSAVFVYGSSGLAVSTQNIFPSCLGSSCPLASVVLIYIRVCGACIPSASPDLLVGSSPNSLCALKFIWCHAQCCGLCSITAAPARKSLCMGVTASPTPAPGTPRSVSHPSDFAFSIPYEWNRAVCSLLGLDSLT